MNFVRSSKVELETLRPRPEHILEANTSSEVLEYDEDGKPHHLIGDRISDKKLLKFLKSQALTGYPARPRVSSRRGGRGLRRDDDAHRRHEPDAARLRAVTQHFGVQAWHRQPELPLYGYALQGVYREGKIRGDPCQPAVQGVDRQKRH